MAKKAYMCKAKNEKKNRLKHISHDFHLPKRKNAMLRNGINGVDALKAEAAILIMDADLQQNL